MDVAVFRPAPRNALRALLLGALGGAAVGVLAGVSLLPAALLGAVASAIAVGVRHAAGLRLVATERGLAVRGGGSGLEARWGELRLGFGASPRPAGSPQRYAIVADARGRSFAFADLAGGAPPEPVRGLDGGPVEVVSLRDAPLLLALVVQRAPAWHVLPPALRSESGPLAGPPGAEPVPSAALDPAAPAPSAAPSSAQPAPPRAGRIGIVGLVAKLGGTVLKALKTANLGWAAASAAAYGVVFSWKFALALLLQLFVHEYGHVQAMRRTGMTVRGMYFIPFLGAVAVSEDAFTSRQQQAFVALSGPIWGATFALVPAALWRLTGHPVFAAVAAWWALINLFNLLPILPLDGGRLLQALAYSYSSALGLALTVLGLAAAVVVGSALGYGLVWLVALLGTMELVAESQARAGGRALRLLPERVRFGPEHFKYLRAVAGPPLGAPSEPLYLRDLARMERAAGAAPLTPRQIAGWGLAYAALAGGLLALIHFMSHVPGADVAALLLS
jgi:Zn-dependent protease